MFDHLPYFVLAASIPKSVWGWISVSIFWVCKGAVQGGVSKFTEHWVDSYYVSQGKEKKYDICKKHVDMSDKTLSDIDWIVLESPVDGVPFSLNLRGTNVTDQDLIDHLKDQKLLRKLDVCYCEDITYRGIRKFRKLRPDCRVRHNCLRFWNYLIGFLILAGTAIKLIIEFT